MIKEAKSITKAAINETNKIKQLANKYKKISMLSRTHTNASPTTMGKEFANFHHRINKISLSVDQRTMTGKINGAVGNYKCSQGSLS